jgi:hypothetical protein
MLRRNLFVRFGAGLLAGAVGAFALMGGHATPHAVAQPTGDSRAKQPSPDGPDEIVLTFRGQIDGSDQIKISPTQATWRHSYWEMPPEPVTLNGISWDPREQRTLKNEGKTRFLPRPVDFRSARLKGCTKRQVYAVSRRRSIK